MNDYHRALRAGAEVALPGTKFPIQAAGGGDWTRAGRGTKGTTRINFSVVSGVTTRAAGRVEPNYVLKIPPLSEVKTTLGWWLSWFEEWETVEGSTTEVTLRSSSLGFYYGSRHAAEPEALAFRAEWGPFTLGLIQSGNAAHPHWHSHHEVLIANTQANDISHVYLHGFHLPMAGWTHSTIEPATCWQFAPTGSGPLILHDWAVRTIKYFQTQLGEEEVATTR